MRCFHTYVLIYPSLSLVKIPFEFAWMMATPRGVEEGMSDKDVARVASVLVPAIAAVWSE